jgi:hypothetical protein
MSLILEALRKLEREKQAPEPGVLVVAHREWPERRRARLPVWLGAATVLTATALLTGWWLQRERRAPSAQEPPRAAAPAAAPLTLPEPATLAPAAPVAPAAMVPGPPAVATTARETEGEPGRSRVSPPATRAAQAPVGSASAGPAGGRAGADPVRTQPQRDTAPVEPLASATGQRPEAAPAPPPRFTLQAIGVRDGRPVAMLNDRLVREGDAFDGIRVLRIGTAEIELEVDGERQVIRF